VPGAPRADGVGKNDYALRQSGKKKTRFTMPTFPVTPEAIATAFRLPRAVARAEPLGSGLIHDTYLLRAEDGTAIAVLQRINTRVFAEPARQMTNLRLVTRHVEAHGRAALRFPRVLRTHDNADLVVDKGVCWRAMEYLDDTRTLVVARTPAQAAAIGRALGQFHAMVQDLDCRALTETLRQFHATPAYLARFDDALATATPEMSAEIESLHAFIDDHRAGAPVLDDAQASGLLPRRTVHGDPKVDNFLVDLDADRVVALIDLDTINCGLVQYDIGDCLRSVCNPAGESPPELSSARFDLAFCTAALEAYLAEAGRFFTPVDYEFLYPAIALIPFELGLRFLTDYLAGDQYFKTTYRGQNLHRARVQFRLVAEIERHRPQIESLIESARQK